MKSWYNGSINSFIDQTDEMKLLLDQQESAQIQSFLNGLVQLEGIGPDYLVADPSMLGPESIRFFMIDENWINCLIDGALSTGGEEWINWGRKLRQESADTVRTGFILRSVIVKVFPKIVVTAQQNNNELVVVCK